VYISLDTNWFLVERGKQRYLHHKVDVVQFWTILTSGTNISHTKTSDEMKTHQIPIKLKMACIYVLKSNQLLGHVNEEEQHQHERVKLNESKYRSCSFIKKTNSGMGVLK
jgi:hypothetical protein